MFLKVLLLAFFLLIANAWLTYHIGNDFIQKYLVGGVFVFCGFVSFLVQYLQKEEEEHIKQVYGRWLSRFMNFQVIGGLYILLFMVGCFVSSVHISTNKVQSSAMVSLHPGGRSGGQPIGLELSGKRPSAQKTVVTTPFGRIFTIDTKGYQQAEFPVFPWLGKRINLEHDLAVSPTIIVRVPIEYFPQLSRAKINVEHNKQLATTYELNNHATIILGQLSEIPERFFDRWQVELRALYEENVVIYSGLNKWTIQEPLIIPMDFQVYDSLRLELTSSSGKIFAVCEGIPGTEKFKELQFKTVKE